MTGSCKKKEKHDPRRTSIKDAETRQEIAKTGDRKLNSAMGPRFQRRRLLKSYQLLLLTPESELGVGSYRGGNGPRHQQQRICKLVGT